MKICEDYRKKIEDEWEEPIRRRKERRKKKCKEKKCNKWVLCLNKLVCHFRTLIWWIVEWVVRIIVKWLVYTICRIISSIVTLFLLILFLAWMYFCQITAPFRPSTYQSYDELADLSTRQLRTLEIEVIIIDKDDNTKNPVTEAELDARIADANRILTQRARIQVEKAGPIRRQISSSLYEVGSAEVESEWFKGFGLLLGRNSVRHLTVYVVGDIEGAEATHKTFYGSVFIDAGNPQTTLAHELGHALLNFDVMGHSSLKGNLMFVPWDEREDAAGWPRGTPTLTPQQWCSMRQSRWVNWSWHCDRCLGLDKGPERVGTALMAPEEYQRCG